MTYTPITSLQHLMELASDEEGVNCFIHLNGNARSSKTIWYYPEDETFDVLNEIDDTLQEGLTDMALAMETNIVAALDKGALYKYD